MQDYKLVVRSLTGGNTILDRPGGNVIYQNFLEFNDWLHTMYLGEGYEVKDTQFVSKGSIDPEAGGGVYYEFAYHLVKELNVSKNKPKGNVGEPEKPETGQPKG